ncbi:MAG: hypothetical protein Q7I89_04710 [Syntrophales bacterium]|nr:hypothetical protein [Syntrophales bacterium]
MKTQSLVCHPIGIIHSPYRDLADMPIQPTGATGVAGTVAVDENYREGLKDADGRFRS